MADTDEPFANRWSRRKKEKHQKVQPSGADLKEESVSSGPAESLPEAADEEGIPPDLPDIDSLDKESDYSVFLKEGVPEELTRLALRKLWRSDPVLAVLDGLNDYDGDYNTPIAIAKNLMNGLEKTAKGAQHAATKEDGSAHEQPTEHRDETPGHTPRSDAKESVGDAAETDDGTEGDDKEIG